MLRSNSNNCNFTIRFTSKHIILPLGTTQLRCIQPGKYLGDAGYKATVGRLYRSVPGHNEIDILHRAILDEYTDNFITYAKLLGNPVIYDTDDLIFDKNGTNYLNKIGKRGDDDSELFKSAMQKCHAVTVSTPFLAEKVRAFHPNVYLLRNALSEEYLEKAAITAEQKIYSSTTSLTIAYLSGSRSHDEDFKIVQPALLKILETYKNCRVLLVGELEFSLDFKKFGKQFEYKERIPYEEYANIFSEIDINLIPLDLKEPFCHGKSELKYIEAGACAVPSIASPTTTYTEVINDGVNGLLVKSNDSWYEFIESLIVDADKRKSIGIKAREHALKEYSPDSRKTEWADFINKTWSEKAIRGTNKQLLRRLKLRTTLEVARALRFSRILASRIIRLQLA